MISTLFQSIEPEQAQKLHPMFYVYIDWTQEEIPRAFYIGKGTKKQVANKKRNVKHTWVKRIYGMQREIICITVDESFAFDLEKELIKLNDTYEPDVMTRNNIKCNWTIGGDGASGARYKRSPEFRKKISEKLKGVPKSEITKEHLRESSKAAWMDPEKRTKMLNAMKTRKKRPPTTDLARQHMRKARASSYRKEIIRTRDEEMKSVEAMIAKRWETQEQRDKQSENSKKMWADVETRKRIIEKCRMTRHANKVEIERLMDEDFQ